MGRLTIGQKAGRVLAFLMGLRNPRITSALAAHGFSEDDRQEGYRLLRALTDDRLASVVPVPRDTGTLEALDGWENTWFPIVRATLQNRFPRVASEVFRNLGQTSGHEVVVSVETLLARLDAVAARTDDESRAASALLLRRGLDATTLAHARSLVDAAKAVLPPPPSPSIDPAVIAEREETLWRWYLEWSQIARTVIDDGRLLRELGFGGPRREPLDDEAPEAPESVPDAAAAGG